jgi:hypothetical protein
MYFDLEFSGEEMKVPRLHSVKFEVRGAILGNCSFASFFQMLLIRNIKIPSMLFIQISRHISFFKLTPEYLEYIL